MTSLPKLTNLKPEVSVGLILTRPDVNREYTEILLQLRKGSHQSGVWACPGGGKMEMWEDFIDTAIRETNEEAGPGLAYTEPIFLDVMNTKFPEENKQYIVIFMYAVWLSGMPKVMEPEKCQEWQWFKWNALPENLIQGNKLLREKWKYLPV